jgi:hypothetical protein
MTTSTAKLLSEISDDGLFERLATAVLREADQRYATLVHSGVNADGKAVKSQLDGIAYVPGTNPVQIVAVHHTTMKQSALKSKWLHDPATVTVRKGGRPTAPAGDFIKTAAIVSEERGRFPQLEATLVLTTNQEPSVDVVREVQAAAQGQSITIDLWPRSRLAHFLDKPEGQWIRRTYLGIEPEYLSRELLVKLSHDSVQNSKPIDEQSDAWVSRSLDRALDETRNDVVFIVAESGFGKSVACYKKLLRHIDRGGFGLILPHEILESAVNVDHAIDTALRQLHPHLARNAGSKVLSLCDSANPFLVVVEDINRSGRGAQFLEKLAGWSTPHDSETKDQGGAPQAWQLLCPVWPELLLSLKDQTRARVEALSISCPPLTVEEARQAAQRRAAVTGRTLSDMDADAIASALGHDPLLIALHDPNRTPDAYHVVDAYIEGSLLRAASEHAEFTAPDYHAGLFALSRQMLVRKQLEPRWNDVVAWFGLSGGVTNILRRLLEHGVIIRLAPDGTNARLRFRHDRVRDSLLSSAVAEMMSARTLDDSILADPFFAEIIGSALVNPMLPVTSINDVESTNPLALFFALRRIGSKKDGRYSAIVNAINSWLNQNGALDKAQQHLRWQCLWVLSKTESPDVIDLTNRFQKRGWSPWAARFRNGDVMGGIELCRAIEPGSNASWRDIQIEHAKLRFGKKLISQLCILLQEAELPAEVRSGSLRLAGHLADVELAGSIATSWIIDAERSIHLQDYLWAGARCCGDNPAKLLGPVCDAWAALPLKAEKQGKSSAREDLAAHNVRFAFRRWPPVDAVRYFIERAGEVELNWPITFLLHGMDNPDALEFIAGQMAAMKRRFEGSDGVSHFVMMAPNEWDPDRRQGCGPMSAASKSRLLALWEPRGSEKHLREQAFRLWAASEADGDLAILRLIGSTDDLYDTALFQRLRRSDFQAVPVLLEKLHTDREDFWWQVGRYIWTDQMTDALDESLTRRALSAKRGWDKPESGSDWITSENLLRLPTEIAERLLLKHWDHLHFVPYFIQAALHTATPALLSRVAKAMADCPDPKDLMKYIDSHYNLKRNGGTGVNRLAQVESLIPYFNLFSDLAIDHFWSLCNERGWFDFRRLHLDRLLTHPRQTEFLGGQNTFRALDEFLEKDRLHWMDHWLEQFLETGTTVAEIVEELSNWLTSKPTAGALRVVAEALVKVGRRSDLAILSSISFQPRDVAAEIIADTTFAVMRRTLH